MSLSTENRNLKTIHIDQASTAEMLRMISEENMNSVRAVDAALEQIAPVVDAAADSAVCLPDLPPSYIRYMDEDIIIVLADKGPGIPDVELAMQEGYSTAREHIRSLGFGAGMGLPNMKKYTDTMKIDTTLGVGTTITMTVKHKA